jgi:hypothetical protein
VFRRQEQEAARAQETARLEERRRAQEADFAVRMEQEVAQQEKVTAKMKVLSVVTMIIQDEGACGHPRPLFISLTVSFVVFLCPDVDGRTYLSSTDLNCPIDGPPCVACS